MTISILKSLFQNHREQSLFGRYIHTGSIQPLLEKMSASFRIETIGFSVNELPIYRITFGLGEKKILMWSQMHGNESTTTKAIFDLCNVFLDKNSSVQTILKECTVSIIPILNPDGAKAYTRLNDNDVDLNRDAQELSQPESKVLRRVFDQFQPDYCFNLHGQRTIYSAGNTNNSAVVSFLAPAQDQERLITETRKIAMSLIVSMNAILQQQIEQQVGIYDDTFNLNCVGDTFQSMNVPTVLFEAGHFPNDYEREHTREFIFQSLLVSLDDIATNKFEDRSFNEYLDIPKNEKLFYDVIIRNTNNKDIAIQFQERLIDDSVEFIPIVEKISDLKTFYAHKEIDAKGHEVLDENNLVLIEGSEIVFVIINNEKFSLKV